MRKRAGLVMLLALGGCQKQMVPERPLRPEPAVAEPASLETAADVKPAVPADVLALDAQTRRVAKAACRPKEETIFYCKITGGKRLSVCATEGGKGEYRYGGDAPELTLSGGEWAVDRWSRGGESQLRFSNGDTSYLVFSRMVSTSVEEGGSGPAISDGVLVMREDEVLALRLCEGKQAEIPVQYDAAARAFGERHDLFTGATAQADTVE